MAKKGKQAEATNNVHECYEEKVALKQQDIALKDISLPTDEINMVWDFYVSHAPIKKDKTEKGNGFGYRSLAEFGWRGTGGLTELERRLIKAAGLGHFVMIKADEITETLESMNLNGEICWKHPRAVLKRNFKVKVHESGEISVDATESRMLCLFRHIRNALAHNRMYFSEDGTMVLLEDAEDGGRLTARILIPIHSLVEWIEIVDKDKKFYFKPQDENKEVSPCPA